MVSAVRGVAVVAAALRGWEVAMMAAAAAAATETAAVVAADRVVAAIVVRAVVEKAQAAWGTEAEVVVAAEGRG